MPTLQQQATVYVRRWFRASGWKAFAFQEETWAAYLKGEHGLVHAPTGTGKTLAAFLGPVIEWLAGESDLLRKLKKVQQERLAAGAEVEFEEGANASKIEPPVKRSSIDKLNRVKAQRRKLPKLNPNSKVRVLWVTPLRALATDTEASLKRAITQLGVPWQIEKRTGDTDPAVRSRQRTRFPEVLITTPESLTLMLSWPDTLERFSELRLVVVDEWHDLMGSKRGVQTELALARVRKLQPNARVWGMSATIGNLEQALETLCGNFDDGVGNNDGVKSKSETNGENYDKATSESKPPGRLIHGKQEKRIEIDSIIPEDIERFPWSGHLGTRLAREVAELVATTNSSLVFTNTRSQTEFWYKALLNADPELAGQIAVHHGSLDRGLRHWVEDSLREGTLRCVVCTASLDLGVDFTVVDHVVQVGSPKGNARLLQRAGRSGHQPGVPSRVTFVPTNTIELVELAALRDAIAEGNIESRTPIPKPLDVLSQHVVTIALGGGFVPGELLEEVRSTAAYATLTGVEWQWVLDFCERGGSSLKAYPDFHRIEKTGDQFTVTDKRVARMHRLSIGTIVSEAAMNVRYLKGGSLGSVEESFIGRMEPGDKFLLGGKLLELVKVYDNTAWVRKGKGSTTTIPRWMGGRMPLSSELSRAIRQKLQEALDGFFESPEMRAVKPLLELQNTWSILPNTNQLLIERLKNRFGYHIFVYPFEGRMVHEGMAALFAWRLSQLQPISFAMAMNDYGFVLTSPTEAPLQESLANGLLDWMTIAEDIASSLNASEMSKRHFREISRIAGLVSEGYPGQRKSARHLQASSNLFYDVFTEYDPENLLLLQSRREVLERQLEHQRIVSVLKRIDKSEVIVRDLKRETPLAFPLVVDSLRDRLSSEKLSDRIRRMQESLEVAADRTMGTGEARKK